jgi:hypothetical protein
VPEPERLSAVLDRAAEAKIAERWRLFGPECDERRRRLWAASEAKAHGPGGVALLARVTGLSEETVRRGVGELEGGERVPSLDSRDTKAELSDQVSLTSSCRRAGLHRAGWLCFRAAGAVQYVRYSPIVPAATADQGVNR